MEIPLAAALISFVVTFAMARLMLSWSPRLGLLDLPNAARKPHTTPTPFGGMAIVSGAVFGSLLLLPLNIAQVGWILGGLLMAALGLADDRFDLSAGIKLLGQALISLCPILVMGFGIHSLDFFGVEVALGVFALPFAMLWIVGMTNAFNLIDGLDGLAVGAAAIAAGAFFVINLSSGNALGLVLSAAVGGGSLGFILFNAHPARLFLGDGGSYFLGYSMALLSLISFQPNSEVSGSMPLVVVALILLYPIADTVWAIIRRVLAGRSIFAPDQQHLHHQVIKLNFDYSVSVLALYVFFFVASLVALLLYLSSP